MASTNGKKLRSPAARVAIAIVAVLLFPISLPVILLSRRAKKIRRESFLEAFDLLNSGEWEAARKKLHQRRKFVPAGADRLFDASRATSDADWLEHTNAWLRHDTPVRLSLDAGSGPRFHRIAFSRVAPIDRPERISVIMPAFNAETMIRRAVQSVLDQSWRNLELLVVNDKSTDATGAILDELASRDTRLIVLHNSVNAGPYVCKNLALPLASGDFVTGHDADDLALPDRLERQAAALLDSDDHDAVIGHMVRLDPNGVLSFASAVHKNSFDGLHRLAMISLMIRRPVLEKFGFWDSVRFGADSEMLGRLRATLGQRVLIARDLTMLCLDSENSLTAHTEFGLKPGGGTSPIRQAYKDAWESWHDTAPGVLQYRAFSNADRPFSAPAGMVVPDEDIETLYRQHHGTSRPSRAV